VECAASYPRLVCLRLTGDPFRLVTTRTHTKGGGHCSVQSYNINNARVAFLNQRPQLRPAHTPAQACEVCSRGLQVSDFSYEWPAETFHRAHKRQRMHR
jgi:hypothetical protein